MAEYPVSFGNIYETNISPYGSLFNQYGPKKKKLDVFDLYQPDQVINYKW